MSEKILDQLQNLARVTGEEIVQDLKDYIKDDKHDVMLGLTTRALSLKAEALVASSPEERRQLSDDLEFVIARIKTRLETERIIVSKQVLNTVISALKTAITSFGKVGEALVAQAISGVVKGATEGLGEALSDKLGDAFTRD